MSPSPAMDPDGGEARLEPADGRFFTDEELEFERMFARVPLPDKPVSLPKTKDGKIFFYVSRSDRAQIERILHEVRGKTPGLTAAGALVEVCKFYEQWHSDPRGRT